MGVNVKEVGENVGKDDGDFVVGKDVGDDVGDDDVGDDVGDDDVGDDVGDMGADVTGADDGDDVSDTVGDDVGAPVVGVKETEGVTTKSELLVPVLSSEPPSVNTTPSTIPRIIITAIPTQTQYGVPLRCLDSPAPIVEYLWTVLILLFNYCFLKYYIFHNTDTIFK